MDEVTTAGDRTWLARVSRWPLDLLRTILRAFPAAIEGYFRDRLPQHAAGIAYRVLFSLAPLAIILVSIVGIEQIPLPYYRDKVEIERLVTESEIPHSILRLMKSRPSKRCPAYA